MVFIKCDVDNVRLTMHLQVTDSIQFNLITVDT
jgi:hypothetical protein